MRSAPANVRSPASPIHAIASPSIATAASCRTPISDISAPTRRGLSLLADGAATVTRVEMLSSSSVAKRDLFELVVRQAAECVETVGDLSCRKILERVERELLDTEARHRASIDDRASQRVGV